MGMSIANCKSDKSKRYLNHVAINAAVGIARPLAQFAHTLPIEVINFDQTRPDRLG